MNDTATYKPALRYGFLTRFYDGVMRLTMREDFFRARLIRLIHHAAPAVILDVGCGTGTLTVQLSQQFPHSQIIGLDGDPTALALAEQKQQPGPAIRYVQGLSTGLPFTSGSTDVVTCSLLLHHLSDGDKQATLQEIRRVLTPNGELVICDWGKPANRLMRGLFYGVQWLDGFDTTTAHVQGRLPAIIRTAGFNQTRLMGQVNTMWGTLSLFHCL